MLVGWKLFVLRVIGHCTTEIQSERDARHMRAEEAMTAGHSTPSLLIEGRDLCRSVGSEHKLTHGGGGSENGAGARLRTGRW